MCESKTLNLLGDIVTILFILYNFVFIWQNSNKLDYMEEDLIEIYKKLKSLEES